MGWMASLQFPQLHAWCLTCVSQELLLNNIFGKLIDKNGIRLDPNTTSAISNMPTPTDNHTLHSFLGHMSYIGRHIPDLRLACAPLDSSLKTDAKFFMD